MQAEWPVSSIVVTPFDDAAAWTRGDRHTGGLRGAAASTA
jgi:hypothetical protein